MRSILVKCRCRAALFYRCYVWGTLQKEEAWGTPRKENEKEIKCAGKLYNEDKLQETQDIVEKEFLALPDVVADVLNALLYQGAEVARADVLLAGPAESIYQGKARLRTQYEDLCKYEMSGNNAHVR